MKACAKCGQIKPDESFNSESWCQDCVTERVRQWHKDNPDFVQPKQAAVLVERDTVLATYRYCNHIAKYTGRAIDRITSKGLEAPPQLIAIKQMAEQFANAQNDVIQRRRECPWCRETFVQRPGPGRARKYCSDKCRMSARDHKRMIDDPNYNRKHYAKHRDRYLTYSRERYEKTRGSVG